MDARRDPVPPWRLAALPLYACVVALATLVCPFNIAAAGSPPSSWTLPNLNRSDTRAVATSPITAANVSQLRVRWRFGFDHASVHNYTKSPETIRGVVATPIVTGNTVYVQDSTSAVYASLGQPLRRRQLRAQRVVL
jgi:glucose dehydrogenase